MAYAYAIYWKLSTNMADDTISELGIGIANSIFGLALITFWKRALHISIYNIYTNIYHTRVAHEVRHNTPSSPRHSSILNDICNKGIISYSHNTLYITYIRKNLPGWVRFLRQLKTGTTGGSATALNRDVGRQTWIIINIQNNESNSHPRFNTRIISYTPHIH